MPDRRTFLIGFVAGIGYVARASAVEPLLVHYGKTKARCATGIPARDYDYRPRSASQHVTSSTGLLLQRQLTDAELTALRSGTSLLPRDVESQQRFEEIWRNDRGESFVRRRGTEASTQREEAGTTATRTDRRQVESLPPPEFPCPQHPPEVINQSTESRIVTQATPEHPLPRKKVIRLYQLDRDALVVDHCSISQVALQLHQDGVWVLSLRGDQNRRPTPPEPVTYQPRLHIKRNEFVVRMRCLGAFVNEPATVAPMAGKPVLALLDPKPFMVENGEPYFLRHPAHSPDVTTYFDLIDRVAIEFFYR